MEVILKKTEHAICVIKYWRNDKILKVERLKNDLNNKVIETCKVLWFYLNEKYSTIRLSVNYYISFRLAKPLPE